MLDGSTTRHCVFLSLSLSFSLFFHNTAHKKMLIKLRSLMTSHYLEEIYPLFTIITKTSFNDFKWLLFFFSFLSTNQPPATHPPARHPAKYHSTLSRNLQPYISRLCYNSLTTDAGSLEKFEPPHG